MTDERSSAATPGATDTRDLHTRLDDLERQLHQRDQQIRTLTAQLADAAQAERERRLLATLIEKLPVGVYVWHLAAPADPRSFRLVATNPAASEATGVHAHDLLGKTMPECFPDLIETPVPAIYAEVIRSGKPVQLGELRYGDARVRPSVFEVQAVPLPGACVGVLFSNKTAQANTEESLRRSQALFGGIVNLSEDAIISIDAEQRITLFNPAAERIFGYRADAMLGQQLSRLLPERYAATHGQHLARFTQSPDTLRPMSARSQIYGRRSDGSEFPAEATIGKFDLDGAPILTVRLRDISERKRAEEERLQLQEEIIRIQRAALAELSTPLIPISEQVVVMPLVGSIDTHRAEQVMGTLLEGISRNRARVAILDITGVPVVDTQVADSLLRVAQSARLLGTQVVLTGIRPEVAQTLVGLGMGLDGVITRGTLQSGIAYAMGRA